MGDDFTTRLREVAGLKEGCDPSTANILLGCAEYIERLQQRDVFDDGTITHMMARQARTILRLRALADGYRARQCSPCYEKAMGYHALYTTLTGSLRGYMLRDQETGHKQERARIVALLRAKVCANTSTNWDREATALSIVADAIERGEL